MKKFAVALLVGLLAAAMAVPALAQTASGTGTLTAQGEGRAQVRCAECDITLTGNGLLTILDTTGAAEIGVAGNGQREVRETSRGTVYVFRGFDGTASVSGEHLAVALRGDEIDLTATGTGRVWLRGEGTYTVNGETNAWSTTVTALEF